MSRRSSATTVPDETNNDLQDGKLVKQQMAIVQPRPIVIKPYNPANGLNLESAQGVSQDSSTQKTQVRASSSETREQEVKKMREIGSCIRCRFLWKTCSTTTPCGTCAVLELPWSWKGFPCSREKLVNMYQGYMLGLYQNTSFQTINAVKSSIDFVSRLGRLLIKNLDNTLAFKIRYLTTERMTSQLLSSNTSQRRRQYLSSMNPHPSSRALQ